MKLNLRCKKHKTGSTYRNMLAPGKQRTVPETYFVTVRVEGRNARRERAALIKRLRSRVAAHCFRPRRVQKAGKAERAELVFSLPVSEKKTLLASCRGYYFNSGQADGGAASVIAAEPKPRRFGENLDGRFSLPEIVADRRAICYSQQRQFRLRRGGRRERAYRRRYIREPGCQVALYSAYIAHETTTCLLRSV